MPATTWKTTGALLGVALLTSPAMLSYELPLGSHSIREAYFLGQRNDEKMSRFLETYTKRPATPEQGPWISEIKLFTPYADVVDVSRRNTIGYSAQQAQEDYKQRGELVRAYVRIEFTPTYGFAQATESADKVGREHHVRLDAQEFWREFQFRLLQTEEPPAGSQEATRSPRRFVIDPVRSSAEPIYDLRYASSLGPAAPLLGAMVCLDYDAHDVSSQLTEFQVLSPDGQRVSVTFDLSKLR